MLKGYRFNMDKAMRNLGYLVTFGAMITGYGYMFVQMIGQLCK